MTNNSKSIYPARNVSASGPSIRSPILETSVPIQDADLPVLNDSVVFLILRACSSGSPETLTTASVNIPRSSPRTRHGHRNLGLVI